jgi:hypothetical protein
MITTLSDNPSLVKSIAHTLAPSHTLYQFKNGMEQKQFKLSRAGEFCNNATCMDLV